MRLFLSATVFAGLMLSANGAANAQTRGTLPPPRAPTSPIQSYIPPIPTPVEFLNRELSERLFTLRQEAIAQREQDGGTLSAESRSRLQAKLDQIQSAYQRKRSRNTGYHVYSGGV